jgi:hypothetical protein
VGAFHRSGVIIFLNVEDIAIQVNRTADYFSGERGGALRGGIGKIYFFLDARGLAFGGGTGKAKPIWRIWGLFFPSNRRLGGRFYGVWRGPQPAGGGFAAWRLLGIFVAAFL